MPLKILTTVAATAALLIGPHAIGSTTGEPIGRAQSTVVAERESYRSCLRSFDHAAREDMERFRDYDARGWRALHHPSAETVFASGYRAVGIEAIMTALAAHFEDREAIFEWTEKSRFVDRTCTSGLVAYETHYHVPSTGYDETALTTVALTRDRGTWKVIYDQGTELP